MGDDLTQRSSGRVQASAAEGAGYGRLPGERNPAHEDPQWFELDLDDDFDDPDEPDQVPLTSRQRGIP